MLGAIIGDTVGSVYEFNNIKTTDFPFFSPGSNYTDDSVMTMAVAEWLLTDENHSIDTLENCMVSIARQYPCPKGGYGSSFFDWLFHPEYLIDYDDKRISTFITLKEALNKLNASKTEAPKRKPYNSWGNGSAMRASAVGWMFDTLEETERVAKISAEITHNHPEGIKGAQATAAAIFLARTGKSKEEIRNYISTTYGYDLARTCDDIRPVYKWESSCQGTVPEAIVAFMDSTDFESAIRLAVSLGGDSDTLACITGGIAEAFYKEIPKDIAKTMWDKLPETFKEILKSVESRSDYRLPDDLDDKTIPC
jgi:ADP-ribosylglycohydrolase